MAAVAVVFTIGVFGLEVYHTVHNQFKFYIRFQFCGQN